MVIPDMKLYNPGLLSLGMKRRLKEDSERFGGKDTCFNSLLKNNLLKKLFSMSAWLTGIDWSTTSYRLMEVDSVSSFWCKIILTVTIQTKQHVIWTCHDTATIKATN